MASLPSGPSAERLSSRPELRIGEGKYRFADIVETLVICASRSLPGADFAGVHTGLLVVVQTSDAIHQSRVSFLFEDLSDYFFHCLSGPGMNL